MWGFVVFGELDRVAFRVGLAFALFQGGAQLKCVAARPKPLTVPLIESNFLS